MAWSVTLSGRTFTNANVDGNAYADEQNGFPAILQSVAETASSIAGIYATSSSARFAAVGSFDLVTDQTADDVALHVGTMVRAASASDLSVYVVGTVASFTETSLIIDATIAGPGGVATDWIVGHPSLVARHLINDPAPRLAADLDAAGHAITNASNLKSYAVTLGAAFALSV